MNVSGSESDGGPEESEDGSKLAAETSLGSARRTGASAKRGWASKNPKAIDAPLRRRETR